MIGYSGQALLALSWGFYTLVLAHYGWCQKRAPAALRPFLQTYYSWAVACAVTAFFGLIYAYVISDFSLMLVTLHSHTLTPLRYKIAATWGSHEGSMLLWTCLTGVYGMLLVLRRDVPLQAVVLQAILGWLFTTYLMVEAQPFHLLEAPMRQGLDFNPLLQDPAVSYHPPILYLGYMAMAPLFTLAIACRNTMSSHVRLVRLLTLWGWALVTLGIALGSWWAYRELGWGGWWFWDPVENLALIPWLVMTALLHGCRGGKDTAITNPLLVALPFYIIVLGTFLTRSGSLVSVHSFASAQSYGLALIIALLTGTLAYVGYRARRYQDQRGALVRLGIRILLFLAAMLLLSVVVPPLMARWMGQPMLLEENFYNTLLLPIALALPFLMGTVAYTNQLPKKGIGLGALIIGLVLGMTLFLPGYRINILLAIFTIAGAGLLAVSLRRRHSPFMALAHGAFGLMILGMVCDIALSQQDIIVLPLHKKIAIRSGYASLESVTMLHGPNYVAERATIDLLDRKFHPRITLTPERRFYPAAQSYTVETDTWSRWWCDIQMVPDEKLAPTSYRVRVYYHYGMGGIWLGAVLMALAALGRLWVLTLPYRRSFKAAIFT